MNHVDTTDPVAGAAAAADNKFGLIEILIVLAKYKKPILAWSLTAMIIASGLSFVLPNIYQGSTKLLPPQQAQSGAAALLSQLGGVAAAAGIAGVKSPNDLYIGMLKSRTIADKLIARFDLRKVYDQETFEKTRKKLEENTVITSGKDGLITIEVEDESRERVAQIANAYVSELMSLTKVLAVTEASQRRLFFERQLGLSKDNLANAEMMLKSALDTHGVISVDTESRAILETVGRMRAQISAKQIQLNSMQAFVTSSNPEYQRVQEELASLRAELFKLENGRNAGDNVDQPKSGQTGLQNIKILRDVKYYQMLYELLAKQYEVARLDEAKDAATIQVLDVAPVPERKVKPKRALLVILATMATLLLTIVWCLVAESYRRLPTSSLAYSKFAELKSHLRFKR